MVQVVSDHNLAMLVRQIALHCNLAANIYSNMQHKAVSTSHTFSFAILAERSFVYWLLRFQTCFWGN
jgi:hypothetical protein